MYERILVGLDGSECSNNAAQVALRLAEAGPPSLLVGVHVYAARMHRARFEEMEPGLPADYQSEDRLGYLRGAHDGIISGGMRLISDSYLQDLAAEAGRRGVPYRSETPEGRNYVRMMEVARDLGADLVILGAYGQGKVPEAEMGSLCERVLLGLSGGDVMVVRRRWSDRGPIVVGVDGSAEGFRALERAVDIGRTLAAPVWAVAVYDPFFHGGVFKSISTVLSEEGKKSFDFSAQERLHDQIIDRGLETLYRDGLEKGNSIAKARGVELRTEVLTGKVFAQVHHFADLHNARLVVMGRWGLHRERGSIIGSNAMGLARLAHTNVLVVGDPPPVPRALPATAAEGGMTAEGTEPRSGVGAGDGQEAELVVLRKVKRMAPDFHRHIVQGRLQGQVIGPGDRVMVYEVQETVPAGRVRVGPSTRLEFR